MLPRCYPPLKFSTRTYWLIEGKKQHTFLIRLSGHVCLQIFPINHEVIATRNSSKDNPPFWNCSYFGKQFIAHNHLWIQRVIKGIKLLGSGNRPAPCTWVLSFLQLSLPMRCSSSLPSPAVGLGTWQVKGDDWYTKLPQWSVTTLFQKTHLFFLLGSWMFLLPRLSMSNSTETYYLSWSIYDFSKMLCKLRRL